MPAKSALLGVVVSDKMDKSVIVVIKRQIRHEVYGKTQRKSSRFLVHDDTNAAKVGDQVEIIEGRPRSSRKRWVVTRIISNTKAPSLAK